MLVLIESDIAIRSPSDTVGAVAMMLGLVAH
jgi:hypothetical protein